MKRQEFLNLYPLPGKGEQTYERPVFQEVVKVQSIYNKNLEMQKQSIQALPEAYRLKHAAGCTQVTERSLNAIEQQAEQIVASALEKAPMAQAAQKEGIEVTAALETVPFYLHSGELHHWDVYVTFAIHTESMLVDYGRGYKTKMFVFTPEGVHTIQSPPYQEGKKIGMMNVTSDAISIRR
jgi:hypothetical protein